ncbi:hypothetical protein EDB86DRAFT_3241531 [Lactarius hatsudake]|nr:hypothetical protein EDB86DRAFT_3241531 [Lactarius hatsudake]
MNVRVMRVINEPGHGIARGKPWRDKVPMSVYWIQRTATISAGVGFVVMCRAGLRSKAWAWSWKALYGASNLGNHSAKGNKIHYSYAVLSASKGASWGLVHHVGMVPVRADSRVTKSGCGGHGFVYGEGEVEECARGALLASAGETARQVRRWQWDLSLSLRP